MTCLTPGRPAIAPFPVVASTPTALLLDFDGTIAPTDITVELLRQLGAPGWREAVSTLQAGSVGSRIVQDRLLDFLPPDRDVLLEFALAFELDPGTRPLIWAARAAGWAVEVTSDGFGFYVAPLLRRAGIEIAPRAADVVNGPDGSLRLSAPYASRGGTRCTTCTACKLDALLEHRTAGQRVVVVGDGRSDHIVAEEADVVYATASLAEYCQAVGVDFRPWHRLADVLDDLRRRGELPPAIGAPAPVAPAAARSPAPALTPRDRRPS